MTSLNSRTIRTLILAAIGYAITRYAVPAEFASPMVQSAVADIIVFLGFGLAAWYRKNAHVAIKGWWTSK